MRYHSRFIPGEEIDAVAHWDFGAVDSDGLRLEAKIKEAELAEQEAREEAIRQAAYAEGLEHGYAQAMPEVQRQVEAFTNSQGQETARRFAGVIELARSQLDTGEQVAAQNVLALACALAREVLRHEISVNPNVLLPVIREGLGTLFADSKNILIKLHPLDMDMLQDTLRAEFPSLALAFQADSEMSRGGCRIESAGAVVDGTVPTRWAQAVARLGLELPWEEAGDAS